MPSRRLVISLLLTALMAATPLPACIAYFGYVSDPEHIDAITASVSVSTSILAVFDENDYIVDDVADIQSKAGPVVVNLEPIIFNPSPVSNIDCTMYERGPANVTRVNHNLRGNFRNRLDTFFSVNAALFQGSVKVIGLVVHAEVNNACVQHWKINTAAGYVKTKLDNPGYHQPRIIIGYGLTNTPGGAVSHGFPVNPDGTINEFPSQVTMIGYWAYDMFNPNNPSHQNNLNAESWTSISNKLDQALRPYQTTIGVFKAYCQPGALVETAWGIGCPNQAVWKLGVAANNWRTYWLNDPRNEAVLAFLWPDAEDFYGTHAMSPIWSSHSNINATRNCTMAFEVK